MKRRLRIITYAWGRQYVANLLDITLAAVLAPGNLPALAEVFDCEFILLTEQGLFEQIEAHPVYRRVAQLTKARLVPIDDLLVAPLYGMTLTWATYRGMEDLGDAITDMDFLLFTADWIPADGSYRSLIPHLLKRERLIVAPSYCVVSEKVLPRLRERIDPETHVLAMSKREMAALGIPNRHNTIRGKTINSHLFHMDVVEQFYWLVDPHTLLCHQMPIAIVCMRPERWIAEPNTFWDYGTVSELMPNTTPCVLADSDEFLMIELRSETTYDDGLRIGWPDNDTIGKKLASFVTRDHTVYGRHQLVWHSRDLPPDIAQARARLTAFVDEIFTHFEGKEVSYVGHPYWAFQSSLFDLARRKGAAGLGSGGQPLWSYCSKALTSVVNGALADFERNAGKLWQQLAQTIPTIKEQGVEDYIERRNPLIEQLSQQIATIEQAVKVEEAIHQRDVALALKDIAEFRQVMSESSRDADYKFNKSAGLAPVFTAVPAVAAGCGLLARLEERICRVGRHHPLWAPMRHALRILETALRPSELNILWITSDNVKRLSRFTPLAGRAHTRMATFTAAHMEPGDIPWSQHFDLCVFEVDLQDLPRLGRMYENVLPALRPGGKIMAFYFHESMGPFVGDSRFIRNVFPRCDYGNVYYAGSPQSVAALRRLHHARGLFRIDTQTGPSLASVLATLLASPLALKASRIENSRPPETLGMPPPTCTSMTIEIDV